jgi:hypothetical protein
MRRQDKDRSIGRTAATESLVGGISLHISDTCLGIIFLYKFNGMVELMKR